MSARVYVTLPNMFRCFLVQQPVVNKHYDVAKAASEEWIAK